MKFDECYLDHLDEKTLNDKWLDAYIEYDKNQMVGKLSIRMAIVLGIMTCLLIVAHALLLAINGNIPSEVILVTLGITSISAVVVTPGLKQRQLDDHIQRINCALEKVKDGADTHEEKQP